MPEGDALHRAARRLQPLVGQRLEVESPHPRAQVDRGRRARRRARARVGGGGRQEPPAPLRGRGRRPQPPADDRRWRVEPRGKARTRAAVARPPRRGARGVLWNGPVLTLESRPVRRLGPDMLAEASTRRALVAAAARASGERRLGEALQDQRLVAGIGNMWMAEALWAVAASRPGCVSASERRRAARRGRWARAGDAEALATGRPGQRRSTGAPAGRARAAARSCGRAARATTTARRTGVRGCQAGDGAAGGVSRTDGGSRPAPPPRPCAASASAPSPSSAASSRKATSCRSRSRSTSSGAGRRCTSTGRSCAAFVEERASALRGPRGRADRARGAPARAGGGDLRPGARRPEAVRGAGALPHRSARRCWSRPPRRAAASTGTTRSFERAYAELERSLFGARAPTRPSRRSSGSRS